MGSTQQFTANMAVSWGASGQGCSSSGCGTIDTTGRFTAPQTAPNPNVVTVTATSGSNLVATAMVTITAPVSPACAITADPNAITSGNSSALAWSSSDATSASLDNGIGTVPVNGSQSVLPVATTTYSLTVSNGSTSASCSATVTVNPPWTSGNGSFTSIQFTSRVPAADQAYLASLFNEAYPVAVRIYGPPPDVAPLTVDIGCAGNQNDRSSHTICMTAPPSSAQDKDYWNIVFLAEFTGLMINSAHTPLVCSEGICGSTWSTEGWHAVQLLQRALGICDGCSTGAGFPGYILDFDVTRLAGEELIGGQPSPYWHIDNLTISLANASGSGLFEIMGATQSMAAAGDWQNYGALKALKNALNSKANACQCELADADLFDALHTTFSQPIEGVLPDAWTQAQPITHAVGTPGTYAFVWAAETANPEWLEVPCFTRTSAFRFPGVLQEDPCTSGTLTIAISNASGTVQTITLDLSNPSHELSFDTRPYAQGGYRIHTTGTANGVAVAIPDSYFGVFDRSLVPFPQAISTLPNVLFLIGKNADGTISTKTMSAPTGGAPGKFLENANGAAVWQVQATTIPQPEYTLGGRQLPVPLPLSPVYVVDNP